MDGIMRKTLFGVLFSIGLASLATAKEYVFTSTNSTGVSIGTISVSRVVSENPVYDFDGGSGWFVTVTVYFSTPLDSKIDSGFAPPHFFKTYFVPAEWIVQQAGVERLGLITGSTQALLIEQYLTEKLGEDFGVNFGENQ